MLNLTDLEEAVLLALTNASSLDLVQLAERVITGADQVRDCAENLVARGLISRLSTPDGYQIIDPGVSFQGPIHQLEEQVGEVREWVGDLTARHRNRVSTATDSFVEVVADRESARELVRSTHANAVREVLALERPPFLANPGPRFDGSGDLGHQEETLLRRGVRHRIVYEQQVGREDDILRSTTWGEEARLSAALPIRLIVIDNNVAFLPARRDAILLDPLVVVHPGTMLDALVALFESCWDAAVSLAEAENDGGTPRVDGAAQDLARLLALGLSDEAIAARLGMSHRTAQRRIADLMRYLNVRSRFQAGVQAARQGLI